MRMLTTGVGLLRLMAIAGLRRPSRWQALPRSLVSCINAVSSADGLSCHRFRLSGYFLSTLASGYEADTSSVKDFQN